MGVSPSYLAALRAAMSTPQPVDDTTPPETPDPSLVGQPLPPGSPVDEPEAAPHPMLDFNVDYDQLSKDRNDEVMANNNAIDQANNAVLAQQKANAVEDKSAAIIADDQRRRADLRNRLIMAGNKNPEQEVARLMGPVPAAAMADKVKEAVASGDAGVQATPRGIETGISTGAANLSRGAEVPKPEPKEATGSGTVGYVPKPTDEGAARPPLNLKLGGGGVGGSASASSMSSSQVNLSPETEKAFQEARTAHQDLTQAEIASNQADTVGQAQLRQLAEEQASEARTRAEQADKEAARIQSEIDAQSKQVADVKIDPQRLYNSKSTADKIMYHLAIMLGGMGLHGGQPNLVLEQANREVDRDIDAQRQAIESGKQRIADMKGGLAEFYRRTGNMDQAVALAQAKSYESMIHQINEYKSSTNDRVMQARGDGAIAELDGKRAAALDAARAAAEEARRKAAAAAAGGGADAKKLAEYTVQFMKEGHSPEDAKRMAAYALSLVDESAVRGIEGGGGKESDAEKAAKERDATLKVIENAKKNVGEITAGTSVGKLAANHLPAWMPGVEEAIKNDAVREKYNTQAMMAVGAAYKLDTNAAEPKNKELLLHYAHPFVINPGDNETTAMVKMDGLARLMNESASAKGAAITPVSKRVGASPNAPADKSLGFKQ